MWCRLAPCTLIRLQEPSRLHVRTRPEMVVEFPPHTELECKAVGTVTVSQLDGLTGLLEALSSEETRLLKAYELVQNSPGPPPVEVRLQRSLLDSDVAGDQDLGAKWNVRNETVMTRGELKNLPVAVRTVTETDSRGIDVPSFWESLGMYQVHEVIREGSRFTLRGAEQSVQVTVCKLHKLTERGNLEATTVVSPDHRLVEVACRVANGSHTKGVEAIGVAASLYKYTL